MEKRESHHTPVPVVRYSEESVHPLHGRHRELRRSVERLQELADAVGTIPVETFRQRLDDLLLFLTRKLLPHADAENQVIFPLVAATLGSVEATAVLDRDHTEIRRLTDELSGVRARLSEGRLRSSHAKALRRVLYGLAIMTRLHLEHEEIYLALLEAHLTPSELRGALDALVDAEYRAEARMARPVGRETPTNDQD